MRDVSLLCCALAASPAARAFEEFNDGIPNGEAYSCLTCHIASEAGEGWNDFGKDVLEEGGANPDANPDDQNVGFQGAPVWADVCALDSDGDGYDNGEELGDPDCVWGWGDADPEGEVTNPGDGEDFPGGDGTGDGALCTSNAVGRGMPGALAMVGLLAGLLIRPARFRSPRR